MKKILLLFLVVFVFVVSCDKTEGINIAKIVFDVIGYIFTAIIGALGGAKIQKNAIIKDPRNNYNGNIYNYNGNVKRHKKEDKKNDFN